LRLNARLAPSLYLAVVPIRGTPQEPSLAGEGPVLDYAVKMRRFESGSLLVERIASGELQPAHLDRLAQRLAAFHQAAPAVGAGARFGSPDTVMAAVEQVLDDAARLAPALSFEPVRRWLREQAPLLAPHWIERQAAGRVRECHGDLHLGNAVVLGEEVTAFDCIEFDPALRWIDVLSDAGFLVMDLLAHGRRDLAFRFLNAYLEHSGDYAGASVLRFYMVYRALVRALVGWMQPRQPSPDTAPPAAPDYLALAHTLTAPASPRLLVTHGLPGSGKTFVSQCMLEAAGALRIRSDVERKRLFGLAPLEDSRTRAGGGIYAAAATQRTYAHLLALARASLAGGWPTIVDAAFLRRAEREQFRELALALGVPFTILDCRAGMDLLRERVAARQARRDDASEADLAVLETLYDQREPLDEGERALALAVDTAQPPQAALLAADWLRRDAPFRNDPPGPIAGRSQGSTPHRVPAAPPPPGACPGT